MTGWLLSNDVMTAAAFQLYECYITISDDKILNEDKIWQRVSVDAALQGSGPWKRNTN